jgi:hypothetical protein
MLVVAIQQWYTDQESNIENNITYLSKSGRRFSSYHQHRARPPPQNPRRIAEWSGTEKIENTKLVISLANSLQQINNK